MKTFVFSLAIIAVTLPACNGGSTNSLKEAGKTPDSFAARVQAGPAMDNQAAPAEEVLGAYLQLKNTLTADNGKEAALAGKQLHDALQKLDGAAFTAQQKTVYDEVKDDMSEHAGHIGKNAGNIKHQREHFDMLSQDMYDLVKAVKPGRTLYKVHCPMYNDNRGAFWLSEVKEIKNPYQGKKMAACGTVTEEIKP